MDVRLINNKITHYQKINEKQQLIFDQASLKITQIQDVLKDIHIVDHKSYQEYKKYIKLYTKNLKKQNYAKAIIVHNKYQIYYSQLMINSFRNKLSKADTLYQFIQYVESQQTEDIFPYTPFKIFFLNRNIDKFERKQIKLRYLRDIKLRVKKLAHKRTWTLSFRIRHLENNIKEFATKIEDIKSSFVSRYHAKLVDKLIRSKKLVHTPIEKQEKRDKLIKLKKQKRIDINDLKKQKANLKKQFLKDLMNLRHLYIHHEIDKNEYQIKNTQIYDVYAKNKYELRKQIKFVKYNAKNYSNFPTCKYAIELKNIVKYYSNGYLAVKVLDKVNLNIKKGEFVVILGPSGSGKTTLLNIISGMDNASYGSSIIAGDEIIDYNQSQLTKFRRDNIGYVFQQYGLLPNLTVKENIEIGQNLQSNNAKHIDIDMILNSIGMTSQKNKYPNELSGGQQQRVSIARSVAKNPNILFGDEPTGAIDEEMSKDVMRLFLEVNKKYNTTIVIVTHNPILAGLADTVVHVGNGTIKEIEHNNKPKTVDQLNWGSR